MQCKVTIQFYKHTAALPSLIQHNRFLSQVAFLYTQNVCSCWIYKPCNISTVSEVLRENSSERMWRGRIHQEFEQYICHLSNLVRQVVASKEQSRIIPQVNVKIAVIQIIIMQGSGLFESS